MRWSWKGRLRRWRTTPLLSFEQVETLARVTADTAREQRVAHAILVVGSDDDSRQSLARRVESAGFRAVAAHPLDAWTRLEDDPPAAIVLAATRDPAHLTVKLVRALRATTERPLLVAVPWGDRDAGLEALDAGADDVLPSPIGEAELRARLRAHLRAAEARGKQLPAIDA